MKKANYLLLILAIFIFHMAMNYQILKRSQVIRYYDEANRITQGLKFYKLIFLSPEMDIIEKLVGIFSLYGQYHPFLYGFIESLFWYPLNAIKIIDENLIILFTNSLFMSILLMSIYGIGSKLYSKNVGLLSALLVSMFTMVFAHSRVAMLDYPLMCMVSLSFYLLLKTNGFQSLLYSVLSGIAMGLAQLTKESAIIFIFPPLIYYLSKSYSSGCKKKVLLNFMLAISYFIVIAGIVYLRVRNFYVFEVYLAKITYIKSMRPPLFYFNDFMWIAGPIIFFSSLPILISYLANIKKREKILFLWFFVPILLFSIPSNKCHRFILPILPAFAIIVAQELLTNNFFREIRRIYVFVLLSFSIMQYLLQNLGFLNRKCGDNILDDGIPCVKKEEYLPVSLALLDVFKEEKTENSKKILFLFDIGQIEDFLTYKFFLLGLSFSCFSPLKSDGTGSFRFVDWQEDNWRKEVLNSDYLVLKTGFMGGGALRNKSILEQLMDVFSKYKDQFKIISEMKIFDGSIIYVYKKKD